jgi:hypothetical protein
MIWVLNLIAASVECSLELRSHVAFGKLSY